MSKEGAWGVAHDVAVVGATGAVIGAAGYLASRVWPDGEEDRPSGVARRVSDAEAARLARNISKQTGKK